MSWKAVSLFSGVVHANVQVASDSYQFVFVDGRTGAKPRKVFMDTAREINATDIGVAAPSIDLQKILSVRLDGNWLKFGIQADSGNSKTITFYARPNAGMKNYLSVSSVDIGNDYALVIYDVVVATGVARAWLNDGIEITNTSATNGTTFDNNGYDNYNFLSRVDWTPFYGYLAELKVYNVQLSDANREYVRDYLMYKWGL